jgi:hypothetical protein
MEDSLDELETFFFEESFTCFVPSLRNCIPASKDEEEDILYLSQNYYSYWSGAVPVPVWSNINTISFAG